MGFPSFKVINIPRNILNKIIDKDGFKTRIRKRYGLYH